MIERTIIEYLTSKGFTCYLEMPGTVPRGDFLIIQKTGSSMSNQIKSAIVAVQSYSTSLAGAIELNESVITAMLDIVGLSEIGSCDLNSDYNYTDTQIKKYRYQAVFDITHY